MASRRLVPTSVREALLGIPSDIASLERNYLLADDDLDLIGTRRRPENRLGLALHIALLRHPGQGWHDDTEPPAPLVAWLAAQMLELETTLTDAAIALFERLTGRLFTPSRNSQDRSWSASKTQAGRLIRLFGGAIDAMVRAREYDRDPFDVLDEEIGWDRLVASREEIAALGSRANCSTSRRTAERSFRSASSQMVNSRNFATK